MSNSIPILQGTDNETPKRLISDKIYFGTPRFYLRFVLLPHRMVKQLNQIVSIGSSVARPILKSIIFSSRSKLTVNGYTT